MGTKKNPAGAAVIGLSEVENSHALNDLLREPALAARGYRYVHFDGPDRRGIDVALLYNPKAFHLVEAQLIPYIYPTESQPDVDLGFYIDEKGRVKGYPYQNGLLRGDTTYITRGFLTVEGYLGGEKFYFIVNHWPSRGAQSLCIRKNESGRIYGITFIDDKEGVALNGSRLGKGYAANVFNGYFSNPANNPFLDETLYGNPSVCLEQSATVQPLQSNAEEGDNLIDELIEDMADGSFLSTSNDDWKEAAWQRKLRKLSKVNIRRRKR